MPDIEGIVVIVDISAGGVFVTAGLLLPPELAVQAVRSSAAAATVPAVARREGLTAR